MFAIVLKIIFPPQLYPINDTQANSIFYPAKGENGIEWIAIAIYDNVFN